MYTSRKKKWTVMSLLLVVLLVMSSVTAFASFESLNKNADRPSRTYYVGEKVVFDAKIQNTGVYTNTYYYIEDVFYGDLDYITLYRDGNGDAAITFDGGGNVVAPDYELTLDTDYFIDNDKIILRWIDGVGDPHYVMPGTPLEREIPLFPGKGDNKLILGPGEFAYIELHYIVQPEDSGYVFNEINTLGQDSAPDRLSASVTAWFIGISPDTMVNISASAITVYAGDSVDLTITEENTGDDPLTNVYVELYIDNVYDSTLDKDTVGFSGDTNTNGILDVGETWQWMVTNIPVNADTNFEVLGFGTDSLGNEVSFEEGYLDEKDDVDVYVIEPDTMVSITASAITVPVGDTVDLKITEQNTGDDPLTDVYVELYKNAVLHTTLDKDSAGFTGDVNTNGILDVGETWQWMVTGVVVTVDTNFEVLGFGTDSLGNEISFAEGYLNEKDDVTVYVEDLCWGDETAWAYGDDDALPNWDYVNNKFWGWTNGPLGEGTYTWDIYAGAGQNDLDKGEIVGELTVVYAGGIVTVTYQMDPGYYLGETHLWVGDDVLPKVKQGKKEVYTNSPGLFPYGHDFGIDKDDPHPTATTWTWSGDGFEGDIYVAAHAVVWMSVPCEEQMIQ
jgi:hypothetical protein